jgi:hypothetical protein
MSCNEIDRMEILRDLAEKRLRVAEAAKLAHRTLHLDADIHHPQRGGTFDNSEPSPSATVRCAMTASRRIV